MEDEKVGKGEVEKSEENWRGGRGSRRRMEKRGRASTFGGRSTNIFFHHLRNFIVKHDTIERPTLVRTRDFLSHGGEEASRVEESGHPEGGWSTFEQPRIKLLVAIEKVGEPETKSGRLPRNLKKYTKT